MDEKPDQIMNHIETQREQLGRNLNELETRVKGATDWRQQFDRNPMIMMGVALGGGILLGSVVAGSRKHTGRTSSYSASSNYSGASMGISSAATTGSSRSSSSPALREQRRKATDTLEHIKAALIGFATAKVKEFMTEALPGFNQHMDEAERRNTDHERADTGSRYGSQPGSSEHQAGSYGENRPDLASTRTEHSANSPYTQKQQPVGANPGLNI